MDPLQHLVEQLEVDVSQDLIDGGLDLGPGAVERLQAEPLVQRDIPLLLVLLLGVPRPLCGFGIGG